MLLLYGEAVTSGVKGIFTMHGKTMEDIKNNKNNIKNNKKPTQNNGLSLTYFVVWGKMFSETK